MTAGVLIALLAAACFETGYVLQAGEARESSARDALRPSLLARLFARPRWLVGTALGLVGAGLQTVALGLAPVTVVQPVLALGLVGLLALAHRVLGERVGRREITGAALIIGGVFAVALSAPERSSQVTSRGALTVVLVVLAAFAAVPFVRRRALPARLAVLGAAAGDALGALALKLLSDAAAIGHWPTAVGWAAVAAGSGGAALTAEMSALQRIPATRVAPVIVAAQVVVPALAAPFVFGESLRDTALGGAVVLAGVAAAAIGAAVLAASRGVSDLLLGRPEAEARAHDAGGGGQRGL